MGDKHMEYYEHYEFKVKGYLDQQWVNDFKVIYTEDGDTILKGMIQDQAALYGVIKRFRDLGIFLVSVRPIGEFESDRVNE